VTECLCITWLPLCIISVCAHIDILLFWVCDGGSGCLGLSRLYLDFFPCLPLSYHYTWCCLCPVNLCTLGCTLWSYHYAWCRICPVDLRAHGRALPTMPSVTCPMDSACVQCLCAVPVCSGSQLPLTWCIGRDHNSWRGALKDRGNI
jgi:hypothetical protein